MQALITIVIPVFNRAQIVGRTLDSIERQTLRPLDVVLVDNNSTDGSLGVLENWRDRVSGDGLRVKVLGETAPGACAARNAGLAAVETPWVLFFDSDDTMTPDHCRMAAEAAVSDPAADVVGWGVVMHELSGGRSIRHFYAKDAAFHNIFHGSMATQRYMCRTDLVRKCGAWSDGIAGWNDVELGMRILAMAGKIINAGRCDTVDVWCGEESITGKNFNSGASRFETSLDRMQSYATPSLARAINLKRMILAGDCCAEGAAETAGRLRRRALADEPSAFYRMLLRTVYAYVRRGGRGVARLLRPFYGITLR
ncbi:MAG: glycosyltransferase family A protein [Bacteroidales bacterium]|nr:glycosyltransferase family A protein [Bacteroidales bacterium]